MHFVLVFAPGTGAEVCKDTNILYIFGGSEMLLIDVRCFVLLCIVCLSVCLSFFLSVYLSVCLSVGVIINPIQGY